MTTAEHYMQKALALAGQIFTAAPNPRVGCVIVRDGTVVGEGWHERAGEPHAEINALQQAGEMARGASVYVTLEPCCVHGRTPPCTEALKAAGVAEVIYGMQDPNPAVAGQGFERLKAAGIRVRGPVLELKSRALNAGFIKRMTQQLPFVRCKMAMSLDGRTAMASGESKWITGHAARRDVQRLRAESCAMLTGVNTVIADDPMLNVRADQLDESDADLIAGRQPMRVVIDTALRTPPRSRIIEQAGEVLLLVGKPHDRQLERFAGSSAQIRELPLDAHNRVDLRSAMRLLAKDFECNEVMLEAGPTLGGAMVQAGLVDEVVVYIGACFLGSDAMPLLNLPGMHRMKDHVALKMTDVRMIEEDCRITAQVLYNQSAE